MDIAHPAREKKNKIRTSLWFRTTTSGSSWRSLKDCVSALRENQTAIYYVAGPDHARLEALPQLEGFRVHGIEVLLRPDR
jgi:molecular chaperone HtpG